VTGSARLWLPESFVAPWLASEPPTVPGPPPDSLARFGELTGTWRAEGGTVTLARGLRTLRIGGVLPLVDSSLQGPPANLSGPIELALGLSSLGGRYRLPAEPAPFSGGGRLTLTGPLHFVSTPREAIPVKPTAEPDPTSAPTIADTDPTDVPVTLTVELGRINLPLRRLADLKPGDILELGRHSREPVELTSGGRLVARGELVQIDTELGVRVTNVFL
jgi:flagellar motor switch protein FliN/FliY